MRRVLEYIALAIVLAFAFDAWISFTSCQIIADHAGQYQYSVKHCSIFDGPFLKFLISSAIFFDLHGEAVTAAFTIVLAVSTIALWWSTRRLWQAHDEQIRTSRDIAALQARQTRASIREIKRSADAAELSARAAVKIELPVIHFGRPNLIWVEEPRKEPGPLAGAVHEGLQLKKYTAFDKIQIFNNGRTSAFPKDIGFGWKITKSLPETPDYTSIMTFNPQNIIKADDNIWIEIPYDFYIELSPAQQATVQAGTTDVWFYGFLTYDDFMDESHEARFCYRWQRAGPRYYRFGSDIRSPAIYTRKT